MAEEKESLMGCLAQMQEEQALRLKGAKIQGPFPLTSQPSFANPADAALIIRNPEGMRFRFSAYPSGRAEIEASHEGKRGVFSLSPAGDVTRDTLGTLPVPAAVMAKALALSFNRCLR